MANELPDPVQYPTVTVDGQSFEVKFWCEDIMRLKLEHGIDVLAQNPGPRKLQRKVREAVDAFRAAVDSGDHAAIEAASERLEDAQDVLSEATGGWQHPLDILDVEQRMKILSVGLRHTGKDFTPERLSQLIPAEDFQTVSAAAVSAILKVSAQTKPVASQAK